MPIQWFPGHMHKARTEMAAAIPRVDLLIEVLDARVPYSSENPMIAELSGDKPRLKVLAKRDLADPDLTSVWIEHFAKIEGVGARSVTTRDISTIRNLKTAIIETVARTNHKKSSEAKINSMVVGIPNVGKSTIINILAGKKVAKTGNEPAVTKGQQRINIGDGITLLDTPGVMWPNVENIKSGLRLALIGSIKDTAMDYADIGFFAAGILLEQYPDRVVKRYLLDEVPETDAQLIEAIGRKRGCLGKSGVVDIDRASRILVNEFRTGMLDRVTLETPEMMHREMVETEARIAEAEERKRKKDAKRKKAFRDKQRIKRKSKRKSP